MKKLFSLFSACLLFSHLTSVYVVAASAAASASTQKSQPQSNAVTSTAAAPSPQPHPAALFPTVMLESAHAYGAHVSQSSHIRIAGASHVLVEFDRRCCTERGRDFLEVKATSPAPASVFGSATGSASASGSGSATGSATGSAFVFGATLSPSSFFGSTDKAASPSALVPGSQPLSLHGSARHWPRTPVVFAGDSGAVDQ